MPKYNVAVARPVGDGWERCEVGNALVEIVKNRYEDPELSAILNDIWHLPVLRYPTSVARNFVVKVCQEKGLDYLFFIDADAGVSEGTFKAFLKFLIEQPVPSVVLAPAVAADGQIQVFRAVTDQPRSDVPLEHWRFERYQRDYASMLKGFTRIVAGGTHVMMIDVRVFQKLKKPYFHYGTNADGTELTSTEDIAWMRKLLHAGVPVFCGWDYPAAHFKEIRLLVPGPLQIEQIPEFYRDWAKAHAEHGTASKLPTHEEWSGEMPDTQNQKFQEERLRGSSPQWAEVERGASDHIKPRPTPKPPPSGVIVLGQPFDMGPVEEKHEDQFFEDRTDGGRLPDDRFPAGEDLRAGAVLAVFPAVGLGDCYWNAKSNDAPVGIAPCDIKRGQLFRALQKAGMTPRYNGGVVVGSVQQMDHQSDEG